MEQEERLKQSTTHHLPLKKSKKKTSPLFRRLTSGIRSTSPTQRSRNNKSQSPEARDESIPSNSNIKTEILSSITTDAKPRTEASEFQQEVSSQTLVSKSTDTTVPLLDSSEQSSTFWRLFFCGSQHASLIDEETVDLSSKEMQLLSRQNTLPEDPTVQESIECIFAHQLQEGLELLQTHYHDSDCRPRTTLQRQSSSNLVHVGTFDPTILHTESEAVKVSTAKQRPASPPLRSAPCSPTTIPTPPPVDCCCCCKTRKTPILEPSHWPQAPLLLRPTPNSGTRVRGIRFAKSSQYLWSPDHDNPP